MGKIYPDSTSLISIRQAAVFAPVPVSASTVYAWIAVGLRGVDGVTIKLNAARYGGRVFTTKAWLDEFFVRIERDVAARRNKYSQSKL